MAFKLKTSKRPLLVLGHGIRLSNQIDNVKEILNILRQ